MKQKDVDQLAAGNISNALEERERVLLAYVRVLTLEPAKTRDADVGRLRKAGWSDEQIFEISFVTAIYAFYDRMADAYGLDYLPDRWQPPHLRKTVRDADPGMRLRQDLPTPEARHGLKQ